MCQIGNACPLCLLSTHQAPQAARTDPYLHCEVRYLFHSSGRGVSCDPGHLASRPGSATSCMTLGKSHHLSGPQFPHLGNEGIAGQSFATEYPSPTPNRAQACFPVKHAPCATSGASLCPFPPRKPTIPKRRMKLKNNPSLVWGSSSVIRAFS